MVNQRLFCRMMEKLGYAVDVAVNGREALECIRRKGEDGYDVLFCDEQMPGMSGPEAAHHIYVDWHEKPNDAAAQSATGGFVLPDMGGLSRIHSESVPPLPSVREGVLPLYDAGVRRPRRPRIIAVSANSDRRDLEGWGGMADDFLTKPIMADALRGCVVRWGSWVQKQRLSDGGIVEE